MSINTLATAALFQKTLDEITVHEALTGWMDGNVKQVIYNGGAEVKIPKRTVAGLADYDRDNGYVQGGIGLSYETRTMTQDRGRKFQLDAMDIDETNFVASASDAMAAFQRERIIPEIDAYRISKLADYAINAEMVRYGYIASSQQTLAEIKTGIKEIRNNGYSGELVCHISYDALYDVELQMAGKLASVSFSQAGIDTRVPSIDGVPLIATPSNRMYTAVTIYDGTTTGQTDGGYAKASTAKTINFIICARTTPIAVTKQDKMKIFTPEQNQDADAWKMNYRRFHDLWVLDNKANSIYVNVAESKS